VQEEGAYRLGSVFQSNASLTRLCLCDCKLQDEGVRALLRKPGRACSLRSLELQRNQISAHGASAIAAFLAGYPGSHGSRPYPPSRIVHLDISHNSLGDMGISLLTRGLREAVALRKLVLQDCDIGVSGMALCRSLCLMICADTRSWVDHAHIISHDSPASLTLLVVENLRHRRHQITSSDLFSA
jgi:Ran GTPase-activating protein (RanGAP) involved in mRNA processing and transport